MSRPSRNTLPRVSEKAEQAAIIQLIESIGGKVYKLGGNRRRGDFPGTMQTPGLPDLFAFLPSRRQSMPIWIEVKSVGGRMRPAQVEFGTQCRHAGMFHLVGCCDDVIKWLTIGGWLRETSGGR